MKVIKTRADMPQRHKPELGFVPTMGALHQGHISLVARARAECEQTCVSIFVNPLQFAPNEDFSKYPRTIDADLDLLEKAGVDIVYLPELEDIYPEFSCDSTRMKSLTVVAAPTLTQINTESKIEKIRANPELSNKLCGLNRPGHFDGVCTVVKRLFDIVQPQRAYFGEKDYQQLMIIKDMVKRLELSVEIVSCPILRETDGLAMSSRNRYLSESERKLAPMLYEEITKLAHTLRLDCIAEAKSKLAANGFIIDYLEAHWNRVFVAAKLGTTRLIDNVN